ncbi:MAG: alanine racemase, partial [Coriobacteriales bacterium]|nr:alanine racemase [Coriobacteriales bacterium]
MDQFMFAVDKSEIIRKPYLRPEVGDEVIIIGRSGDYVLHLDDMADALMTINYELACRFGMRLRKIYIDY